MEKLRLCPFCGSSAELNLDFYWQGVDEQLQEDVAIECTSCNCFLSESYEFGGTAIHKQVAVQKLISRWNERIDE